MINIDTSALMARQQATLQTNLQNIVKPVSSPTFLTKLSNTLNTVNTFIDKAAPIVTTARSIIANGQTRIPGTNIPYNPQLQAQAPAQQNQSSALTPMLIGGGFLLAGFIIYKVASKPSK